MSLRWVVLVKILQLSQPKTLGIKQKYLVVLHLVLRLQLLLVKFVYHWVQILVAQFANLPHSMGLLV